MSFPQSYLIDILNNVRYAIPVERASFPDKWRRKDRPKEDQTSRTPGGQGGGLRDTPTNRGGYGRGDGGGNNWQNPYGQGGLGGGQRFPPYAGQERPPYQGTAGRRDWRAGWTDFRHPKIKALMDPYLDRNDGRLRLGDVLDAGGLRQQDLPTLPRFCWPNGRSFLCWSSTLGRCMFPKCRFQRDGGHPGPNDIPDEFAENVVGKLTKGIQARMQSGGDDGSPDKKLKQEPSNP
jgi:hypothetical protein